jgi:hypothetical protein
MRAAQSRTEATQHKGLIVAVLTRIAALFARLPALTGFSVQDRATLSSEHTIAPLDADLCIADVAVHTWPGLRATPAVREEIVETMLELLDEHPDARGLLRGCTFARTFH